MRTPESQPEYKSYIETITQLGEELSWVPEFIESLLTDFLSQQEDDTNKVKEYENAQRTKMHISYFWVTSKLFLCLKTFPNTNNSQSHQTRTKHKKHVKYRDQTNHYL